jgi:hypothetical protein
MDVHWSRQCRCSGSSQISTLNLGTWCGRPATEEDGLCDKCRTGCVTGGHSDCVVLTMEECQRRAQQDAMAD